MSVGISDDDCKLASIEQSAMRRFHKLHLTSRASYITVYVDTPRGYEINHNRTRTNNAVNAVYSLVPRPSTAAADGLHHRYAERGSGEIAYSFVTSGRSRRWIFNGTIKLQACGDLHF